MEDASFDWKEVIDTGSCCNVFRAIHKRTGTPVALKRLFWNIKPSLILREAQRAYHLDHSGIVKLSAVYREGDQAVLVFELLNFQPFRTIVKMFDVNVTRLYFRGLLEPLRYIHSLHMLHRDIKPANYLYDIETNTGKIIDFGCSEDYVPERVCHRRKRKPHRLGTKGFRAPEVLLGCEHQTTAIDMWSCGVILLSVLTGRYPFFRCDDDVEELVQVMRVVGSDRVTSIARRYGRTITIRGHNCASREMPMKDLCFALNDLLPSKEYHSSVFDLLERLLDPDPETRITAAAALSHPFLK